MRNNKGKAVTISIPSIYLRQKSNRKAQPKKIAQPNTLDELMKTAKKAFRGIMEIKSIYCEDGQLLCDISQVFPGCLLLVSSKSPQASQISQSESQIQTPTKKASPNSTKSPTSASSYQKFFGVKPGESPLQLPPSDKESEVDNNENNENTKKKSFTPHAKRTFIPRDKARLHKRKGNKAKDQQEQDNDYDENDEQNDENNATEIFNNNNENDELAEENEGQNQNKSVNGDNADDNESKSQSKKAGKKKKTFGKKQKRYSDDEPVLVSDDDELVQQNDLDEEEERNEQQGNVENQQNQGKEQQNKANNENDDDDSYDEDMPPETNVKPVNQTQQSSQSTPKNTKTTKKSPNKNSASKKKANTSKKNTPMKTEENQENDGEDEIIEDEPASVEDGFDETPQKLSPQKETPSKSSTKKSTKKRSKKSSKTPQSKKKQQQTNKNSSQIGQESEYSDYSYYTYDEEDQKFEALEKQVNQEIEQETKQNKNQSENANEDENQNQSASFQSENKQSSQMSSPKRSSIFDEDQDSDAPIEYRCSSIYQLLELLTGTETKQETEDNLNKSSKSIAKLTSSSLQIERLQEGRWFKTGVEMLESVGISLPEDVIGKDDMIGLSRVAITNHRQVMPSGASHTMNIVVRGPMGSGITTLLSVLVNEYLVDLVATSEYKKTFVVIYDTRDFVNSWTPEELFHTMLQLTIDHISWQRPDLTPAIPYIKKLIESSLQAYGNMPTIPKGAPIDVHLAAKLERYAASVSRKWGNEEGYADWINECITMPMNIGQILGFTKFTIVFDDLDAIISSYVEAQFPFVNCIVSMNDVFGELLNRYPYIVSVRSFNDFIDQMMCFGDNVRLKPYDTISTIDAINVDDDDRVIGVKLQGRSGIFSMDASKTGGVPAYVALWNKVNHAFDEIDRIVEEYGEDSIEYQEAKISILSTAEALVRTLFLPPRENMELVVETAKRTTKESNK